MRESFIHYIWEYQLFKKDALQTEQGDDIEILSKGIFTGLDGPDFFDARISIGGQLWAGNVEIHFLSSDWYVHQHEKDKRYENVILHVVWQDDVPVFRRDGSLLPTLALEHLVASDLINKYDHLMIAKRFLYCEDKLSTLEPFVWLNWKERLFFERLERKIGPIEGLFKVCQNDWRQSFFCFLAKGFGGSANGDQFLAVFKGLPLTVVLQHSNSLFVLEALFFGISGFLEEDVAIAVDDLYTVNLKKEWAFYKEKYALVSQNSVVFQFFQLRPPNFPTIRLAQFAAAMHLLGEKIFSLFLEDKTMLELYRVFGLVAVSEYWQTHYVFTKVSKKYKKALTKDFVEHLFINTIVPFRFFYLKATGCSQEENLVLIEEMNLLKSEKNSIVTLFKSKGLSVNNALDSQSVIELKKAYCEAKRCLSCMIGIHCLK